MWARLRPRSAYDVIALLALFIAIGGGTAFAVVAANQVNSESIINKEVKTDDIADAAVGPFKIKPGGVGNGNLAPDSVGTGKVINGSLLGEDLASETITGTQIKDRSLGRADVRGSFGFSGRINGLAASTAAEGQLGATQYAAVSGTSTATSGPSQTQMSPNVTVADTAGGEFHVHLKHPVPTGGQRRFTVLETGIGCTVDAGESDCETEPGRLDYISPHRLWQVKIATYGPDSASVATFALQMHEEF